jgi:4-amino-4-deoxy-L-arabinose transferase-like glycosyltransferase
MRGISAAPTKDPALVARSALPAGPALSAGDKLLIAVTLYFVALKLIYSFFAFPIADEAYYWLWGQHPALSYFDHPPLAGWLQGIAHAVLGQSLFALRLPALLAFATIVAVLYKTSVRLAGEGWRHVFLRSLVVYLASPVFFHFGNIVFIDYLLVALMTASGYFFFVFLGDVERAGRGRLRDLFAGAVLLGLAGLAKYNGAYLGLALVGVIVTRPALRPLLRSWPIYAAAVMVLLMLVPVLLWNMQHDFASFRFHLVERNAGVGFTGLNLPAMKAFIVDTASLLSWCLVPVIFRFFWARPEAGFARIGKVVAIWTFWLSSLTFLYISNYSWVQWWWNIAAFVLVIPFSGKYIGPWLLTLHVAWGLFINTVLVVSLVVVPVTVLIGRAPFMETEAGYGWDQITAAVQEARSTHGADFIATNRYQSASQLAYALGDPDVTEISPRRDAFDDWFDAEAHSGQSAIIMLDGREDLEFWRTHFASVEKLVELPVSRFGYAMRTYELYVGTGYIP